MGIDDPRTRRDDPNMLRESKDVVRAILQGDRRPWKTLSDDDDKLAELHFPLASRAEAHQLADSVRTIGFEITESEREYLAESLGAEAHKFIEVVIHFAPVALKGIGATKLLLDTPEMYRKLRNKIAPVLGRLKARVLGAKLQFPLVEDWLNRTYGEGKWNVDPSKIEVKAIADVTLFIVPERRTENLHLLAVDGDEIEELPLEWLPKDSD